MQIPTASAATVTVAWDANTEPGIEGYILYYGTTSPDYLYNVEVGNSTSCTISGLEQGQVYYFAAKAYNAIGESEFSEELVYEIPFNSDTADEVIIDNGDDGTSFTGTWGISSSPDPYGENSLYSNDQGAHYAYEASIAGAYTVSLWWTEHTIWRITNVPVEIFDGDTLLDTVYVNQQTNGGQWNVIGKYDFSGTARVVVVSETDGSEGNDSTCADAVRFVSDEIPADTHTITASAGANGSISPQGAVSVNSGSSQSFTITPAANYQVSDVVVDGSSVGAVTGYTFDNITTDHTIAASFEIDTPEPPPSPNEIIIDNGDEGTSFTGSWKISSSPNPYGENSLYSRGLEVHYTYQAPVNGTYTVMLWWTEHRTRRSNVPVEIYDGDTLLDTVYVNQQTNGGQWNVIGKYDFSGTARVVVVSEGYGTTCVDALRFSR